MFDLVKSPVISLDVYDIKISKHGMEAYNPHPFIALHYKKAGYSIIHCAEKTIIPKENSITLIPANKSHSVEVIEDSAVIAINFNCIDNSVFDTPFNIECDNPRIRNLFEIIYEKYANNDTNNYQYFARFYELLEEIEKHIKINETSKINPKILQAKAEIGNQFSNSDFNINKLSELLDTNASYLRREFNKVYGLSPIAYLKNIRLQNAVSMLISDYYTVNEIAQKCGYSSTSYFIQVFHKAKGCPPQKYKEIYFKSKNNRI